ncbi:MAG: hypothetical protein U0164_19030 [Gemmatimonadaceae bacterium]
MQLGAFSISLSVKSLDASRKFYASLGFEPFAGNAADGWLILRNGACVLGLFQGMFDHNILTFNPGWDQNAQPMSEFTDVREIQRAVKSAGQSLRREADEQSVGPASFEIEDPDGNIILIDQHVG